MANVKIFPDAQQMAKAAAEVFINLANEAIEKRGIFSVVLAGGTTPRALYSLLATEPYSESVDWSRVHVFWGDERCVPPDSPDSNYFKARKILLDYISLPDENIHRIPAELDPEQAAAAYEEILLRYFTTCPDEEERNLASFELVLLGMGDDGHTASLFPGTAAVHEETRWVAAHYVDRLAAWRITLTPAIINRAANIIFLVSGAGKSYTLQRVIYGAYQPSRYPAQIIKPLNGNLTWMIDEAAATLF